MAAWHWELNRVCVRCADLLDFGSLCNVLRCAHFRSHVSLSHAGRQAVHMHMVCPARACRQDMTYKSVMLQASEAK